MHVFGQWEEAIVPRENPYKHVENTHTERRQEDLGIEPGNFLLQETSANHHTNINNYNNNNKNLVD